MQVISFQVAKYHTGYLKNLDLGSYFFLLYINDILLITNFDTTLFVDDTCLMMADQNLKNLEN